MISVGLANKLVSTVVNSLADSRPEFSASERLEFELPDGAASGSSRFFNRRTAPKSSSAPSSTP